MNQVHFKKVLALTIGVALSSLSTSAFAKGEISIINSSSEDATPSEYVKNGKTYRWGQGKNLKVDSFIFNGKTLKYSTQVSRVVLNRVDNASSSGKPCGLFAETTGERYSYQASYPDDGTGSGNCDLGQVMGGAIVNVGALDVFSNSGTVRPHSFSNIERVDFLFDHGILTPFTPSLLSKAGHTVIEKHGNNPVNVAAVTKVDASGTPTDFGPLVFVHPNRAFSRSEETANAEEIQYGITNITTTNDFLTNERHHPQGYVELKDGDTETLGMAFVSVADLGLSAGQRYYGFAFFGADVTDNHTLTDPSTFPQDTPTDRQALGSGDADLFGATGGYAEMGGISGTLYDDANHNGSQDASEPGIPGITVTLIEDSNGNGTYDPGTDQALGDPAETDENGSYFFPGVPEGDYFVQVDGNDPDLPTGSDTGSPAPVSVGGDNTGISQNFPIGTGNGTGTGDGTGTNDNTVLGETGSPPIETGLVGSGTGSFDGLFLFLAGAATWYRRKYLTRS
jgi:hypothetical protein